MLFKHTLHVDPFIHIKYDRSGRQYVLYFCLSLRRPSGIEPEFFVRPFIDLDENPTINMIKTLMMKMFTEQNISFSEVSFCLMFHSPALIIGRCQKSY